MAHPSTVRSKLRAQYVGGMSLSAAAIACGVPYATARRWKTADASEGQDWDIQRNARRMTKSGVEEMANQVLGEIAEQFLVTLEAVKKDEKMGAEKRAQILVQLMDGYNKAIAAAARAMPNANRLAVAMDVVRFLTEFIAEHRPTLRTAFVEIAEAASDDFVRRFGAGGA